MSKLRVAAATVLSTLLTTVLHSTSLAAGSANASTAHAIICRSLDNTIASARMLDLYEWPNENWFVLPQKSLVDDYAENKKQTSLSAYRLFNSTVFNNYLGSAKPAFLRNSFVVQAQIEKVLEDARNKKASENILSAAASSTPPETNDPIALEKNCAIEVVADYQNNHMRLNPEIYLAMNPTHRSTLIAHEALYLFRRNILNESGDARQLRLHVRYLTSWMYNRVPSGDEFYSSYNSTYKYHNTAVYTEKDRTATSNNSVLAFETDASEAKQVRLQLDFYNAENKRLKSQDVILKTDKKSSHEIVISKLASAVEEDSWAKIKVTLLEPENLFTQPFKVVMNLQSLSSATDPASRVNRMSADLWMDMTPRKENVIEIYRAIVPADTSTPALQYNNFLKMK